jgi:hypothetical protein
MRFFVLAMLTVVCVWGGSLFLSRRSVAGAGQAQPPRGRSQSDLSRYPDYPLGTMPTAPISPRFVIEHRSALNGKTVSIRGTVVRVIAPDDAEPSSAAGVAPRPGRFAQPRIFLADSGAKDLDKNHEVVVLLREGDKGYPVGQLVDIEGTVDGNQAAVVVRRLYPD